MKEAIYLPCGIRLEGEAGMNRAPLFLVTGLERELTLVSIGGPVSPLAPVYLTAPMPVDPWNKDEVLRKLKVAGHKKIVDEIPVAPDFQI